MVTLGGWWLLDLALVCLLIRAWSQKLFTRYRFFYTYIAAVLLGELARQYLYHFEPRLYAPGWWITEFVTSMMGFGVTWDIFSHVLGPYRGARRMAHTVLAVLFGGLALKAAVDLSNSSFRALVPTAVDFERNLRVLQALLLLTLIALIVHYALPAGRNLRWMLAGYAVHLGSQIALLSVLSVWGDWPWGRQVLPTVEYCATLIVWCIGMWSYAPNPVPELTLERDYQRISGQTVRAFGRLREHLTQSWRA